MGKTGTKADRKSVAKYTSLRFSRSYVCPKGIYTPKYACNALTYMCALPASVGSSRRLSLLKSVASKPSLAGTTEKPAFAGRLTTSCTWHNALVTRCLMSVLGSWCDDLVWRISRLAVFSYHADRFALAVVPVKPAPNIIWQNSHTRSQGLQGRIYY